MKFTCLLSAVLASVVCAEELPSFDALKARIRPDHPRIFLTKEQLPVFRERAKHTSGKPKFDYTYCGDVLKEIKRYVAAVPEEPSLELKNPKDAEIIDGRMVFHRNFNNQNAIEYGLKYTGGTQAAQCALLYLVTGEEKYYTKALKYMRLCNEFAALSERSRILPEWYNAGRLGFLVAYDWLHDKMTPEERASLLGPMLKHISFMRKPGFQVDGGRHDAGNYGEPGLMWYAGLAGFQEGINDELAEELLKEGYALNCRMMDYREAISGGKGLLTSICTGYSFGEYPWATNHFLLSLQTAANYDARNKWSQPREYAHYFNWMSIPTKDRRDGYYDFGWGDAHHVSNDLGSYQMYTHLAWGLHFYGENPEARALMALIPEHVRGIMRRNLYPWTAFVLTNFDPQAGAVADPVALLSQGTSEYFPSYGLMNMRSGYSVDDTYASIKAGAKEEGHQHLDELAFIIYKKGYQALDTGVRCCLPHHRAYYAQSIAHNTLLVRQDGEPLPRHWYGSNGERIDWNTLHNDGGQIVRKLAKSFGYDTSEYHAVTGADAAACYGLDKCQEASRIFVYVRPDYFIVYDRVESKKAEQQKVFLLHTQNEPAMVDGAWHGQAGQGALFLKTLLPQNAKTEIIGGPGKEFWTNGRNFPCADHELVKPIERIGGIENSWLGRYRLEISPADDVNRTCFLHVMQAADKETPKMVDTKLEVTQETDGVAFTTREGMAVKVAFQRNGEHGGSIRLEQNGKVLLDQPLFPKVQK